MADLQESRLLEFVGAQDEIEPRLDDEVTFCKGGVYAYGSGYVIKPTNTASQGIAGVFAGVIDDGSREETITTAAGSHPKARFLRGKVWLPVSGAAQTDVGVVHYVADSATMTKTAGSKTIGFFALDFKAGYLLFDLRAPVGVAAPAEINLAQISDLSSLTIDMDQITDLDDLTLADLDDVTITTPSNNQVLKYDTGKWVNAAVPN